MFDTAKYANFKVNVIIEELSNVPQLEGEFAVRWKFQGRKPKGKEEELLQPSSRGGSRSYQLILLLWTEDAEWSSSHAKTFFAQYQTILLPPLSTLEPLLNIR